MQALYGIESRYANTVRAWSLHIAQKLRLTPFNRAFGATTGSLFKAKWENSTKNPRKADCIPQHQEKEKHTGSP